jgi:hypothetical protein
MEKQIVGAVGVSCHDFGALKVAAEHPWVDVLLARINYKGGTENWCDAGRDEVASVLKTARNNGKAVIGMKVFNCGKFTRPEDRAASLDFVFKHKLVDAITIGMSNPAEVDDTLSRMERIVA